MSGITDIKKKMRKKVKLGDLSETTDVTKSSSVISDKGVSVRGDKSTKRLGDKSSKPQVTKSLSECGDMSPNTQVNKASKKQVAKSRLTVYLDAETETLFNRMYADKIVKGEKVDKSSMICEAVRLLYKKWS